METKVNKIAWDLVLNYIYIYIYIFKRLKKTVNLNILYITLNQTAKDLWWHLMIEIIHDSIFPDKVSSISKAVAHGKH